MQQIARVQRVKSNAQPLFFSSQFLIFLLQYILSTCRMPCGATAPWRRKRFSSLSTRSDDRGLMGVASEHQTRESMVGDGFSFRCPPARSIRRGSQASSYPHQAGNRPESKASCYCCRRLVDGGVYDFLRAVGSLEAECLPRC